MQTINIVKMLYIHKKTSVKVSNDVDLYSLKVLAHFRP
jgi:hypothetical protein